ncbi:carbohydrate ABC transporter permease [Cohnella pontilimi]|nr:carbohydrate ABC transporter permease [Cohnella pontilimi]
MRKKDIPYAILFLVLLAGGCFMLVPFVWMILSSFKSNLEIISSTSIWPQAPSAEGYVTVVRDAPFMRWLMNSLVTSTAITLGTLFTSALAGYIFAKFHFRGKQTIFVVLLGTMMIPFQVVMIPTYLIISKLGLLNSLLALVVPGLVSAFGVFLARQAVESIPYEMIESARMDGSGEFRTFWQIVLPQITSMLSALGIFTFMAAWNNYLWPLIVLNDNEKMTVPLALVFFNSKNTVNYNVSMSAGVLIMIPVFIVFLLFQRHFIKGLTMTGMK